MGGFCLLVELHRKGSASAACAACSLPTKESAKVHPAPDIARGISVTNIKKAILQHKLLLRDL